LSEQQSSCRWLRASTSQIQVQSAPNNRFVINPHISIATSIIRRRSQFESESGDRLPVSPTKTTSAAGQSIMLNNVRQSGDFIACGLFDEQLMESFLFLHHFPTSKLFLMVMDLRS
jgi:hypothetical protein